MNVDSLLEEIKDLRAHVAADEARVIKLAATLARVIRGRGVTEIRIRFPGIEWSYDDPRTPVRVTRRGFERRARGNGCWEETNPADCLLIAAQLEETLTSVTDGLRDRASTAIEAERLLTRARDS